MDLSVTKDTGRSPEIGRKWKFSFPHEFIIILIMGLLACIMTYIVPAGMYERVQSVTGRMVVNPNVFKFTKNTPVSPVQLPMIIIQGFYEARKLIIALIIFTGSMHIVMATGALRALTSTIIRKFGKRQAFAVAVIMAFIAILSSPMGYNPFIAFVPVGLLLAYELGYDAVVGVAMIAVAAAMGPNAGMLNPSTTGFANNLVGLPTFHGIGFRMIGFVLFTAASILYIIRYALKVKADPSRSVIYGIKQSLPEGADVVDIANDRLTGKQNLVLVVVAICLGILVYGCTKLGWGFQQMTAFFLVLGIFGGIAYGMSSRVMCNQFTEGSRLVMRAVILVGLARSISIILGNGNILDTVVYFVSSLLNYIPAILQGPGMLLIHSIINFFVTSGNGQAVVTMPIMLPVAEIIGMSPETAILALNYGDGFTNIIFPHSAALMAFLVLSDVPYQKWLKFIWKLILIWYLIGSVLLIVAHLSGY